MKRLVVVVVVVVAAACGKSDISENDLAKRGLARKLVEQHAQEGFRTWSFSHPDKACPTIAELAEASFDTAPSEDPWHRPYRIKCGADLPPGAVGIGVYSLGQDGKDGTSDDIKSWWMAESAAEHRR